MNEEKYRQIIDQYIDAYNRFDIAGMIAHMDEDVIFENVSGGEVNLRTNNLQEFKQQAEKATELFLERKQMITGLVFTNDEVEVAIDYKGILAVDLSEDLRAGTTLPLKGRSIFKFSGEKIVRLTDIS